MPSVLGNSEECKIADEESGALCPSRPTIWFFLFFHLETLSFSQI